MMCPPVRSQAQAIDQSSSDATRLFRGFLARLSFGGTFSRPPLPPTLWLPRRRRGDGGFDAVAAENDFLTVAPDNLQVESRVAIHAFVMRQQKLRVSR
jgi:hypothetical protein